MIRTVVFDVGNVIWFFEEPLYLMHQRLAALVGLSYDDYYTRYVIAYQSFEIDSSTLDAWITTLNPAITSIQIQTVLDSSLAHIQYNLPVLDIIAQLRRQGITIGLLSNCENFLYPYIHQPLAQFVDYSILSWQQKVRKPNPTIYDKIFTFGNWQPSEVLFVDDKPENINAVRPLGIQGLPFFDNLQLRTDLQKQGLLPSNSSIVQL